MSFVLYVDDNPADRDYVEIVFERDQMDVVCVSTTKEALDMIMSDPGKWSLIVSDILMPGDDDGLYFAQNLESKNINIPIILASGEEKMRVFKHYSALRNYKGFIEKPVTPQKLNALLEKQSAKT